MERKYGQRGYMDNGAPEREKSREGARQKPKGGPKGSNRDIPRTVHMPGFQEVLRCSLCGAIVPPPVDIAFESQCPKCKADLRACKNCRHFDTGAQFECTQPIRERIVKKDIRNPCTFFMARTSIERETRESNSGSVAQAAPAPRPSDARSAFDNLFKK
jgi:hypothetical protein